MANSRGEIIKYLQSYKVNRNIKSIVIHCSASKPDVLVSVDVIDKWHKARGFSKQKESGCYCGYHFVIPVDGSIEIGRRLNEVGAHVAGANSNTIGIVYGGGLDAQGKAKDTRTASQTDGLIFLLQQLVCIFPKATICGHRDYSPDKNGNGIVEPWEWLKACPCFDAKEEYKNI